jgi:hypothetical protein
VLRYLLAMASLAALPALADTHALATMRDVHFDVFDLDAADGSSPSISLLSGEAHAHADIYYFTGQLVEGAVGDPLGPARVAEHNIRVDALTTAGTVVDASRRGPSAAARVSHAPNPNGQFTDGFVTSRATAEVMFHVLFSIAPHTAVRLSADYAFDLGVSQPGDWAAGYANLKIAPGSDPHGNDWRGAHAELVTSFEDGVTSEQLPEVLSVWWFNPSDSPAEIVAWASTSSVQTHHLQPVPEPSSALMWAVGAAALVGSRRLTRSKKVTTTVPGD